MGLQGFATCGPAELYISVSILGQLNVPSGLSYVFISKYSRKHVELTSFLHLTQANVGKVSASLRILLKEGKQHH